MRISAAIAGLIPTTIVGFALITNTQIEPARAAVELYEIAGRFDPKPPPPPRPLSQRELDEIIRQELARPCPVNPLDIAQFGEKKAYQIARACSRGRRYKLKPRVRSRSRVRFY